MANAEKTVKKSRPHTYTAEERLALGSKIADTLDEQEQIARDKKRAVAEYKVLEEEVDNKLKNLRENHKKGYEIREFECYEMRDVETKTVNYVAMDGTIIDSRPFTSADWDVIMGKAQIGLFPEDDGFGPDEDEIRAYAAQQEKANTPVDFEPAAITVSLPNWDAESQAQYNNLCATTVGMSLEDLEATLENVNSPAPFKDEKEATVYDEFRKHLESKIEGIKSLGSVIEEVKANYGELPTPEQMDELTNMHQYGDVTNDQGEAIGSVHISPASERDELDEPHNHGSFGGGPDKDTDDTDEEDEDQAGSDEPSDDDKPKTRTPKRPARRIDPK
jgi:hypothetical protein